MIKRIVYFLFVALLGFACSDKDVDNENTSGNGKLQISIDKTDIVLPAEGGSATFTVTANGTWYIQGAKAWCQISPAKGEAGETTVEVRVVENPTLYEDRNTTLSVSGENLTVTQKKVNAIILSQDKFTVPMKGDTVSIEVKHNVDLEVVIPEESAGWISQLIPSKALATTNYSFIIGKNEGLETRSGQIIFKDKATTAADTVYIFQAYEEVLALVNDLATVKNTGGELMVELRSNLTYEVIIPDQFGWLHKAPENRAIRDDRVYFTADPLEGEDNREAIVIFKASGRTATDTLGICQIADGSLLLMKSVFELGAEATTLRVKLKECRFETELLTNSGVWIEKISPAPATKGGFRKDSLTYNIRRNVTAQTRYAAIVFTETETGIHDTLKIFQQGVDIPPAITGNRLARASYNPAREKDKGVLISWRLLPEDDENIAFDIYRSVNGGEETLLNDQPITSSSCFKDATARIGDINTYRITQSGTQQTLANCEMTPALAANFYRSIPLNMNVPDPSFEYLPGDAAVGDLDGDGEYEIVLKREVNPTDNTADGGPQRGTMLLEAYRMDGSFMWRINMGKNIRQGPHYTPFIVYDLDGDGRDEIAIRTAEGTEFGDGYVIGDVDGDGKTDYVNPKTGLVLEGPEFLSVIDGATGIELARTGYIPRGDEATWKEYWGDNWGNRIDRFLMGVGDFGGSRPNIAICRGYYHNFQIWAVEYTGGELQVRWKFNTDPNYPSYRAQGNHNLSIGDVDNDGYDEIIYGACAIDHNGKGMYSTGLGHGDALHLGDFDPERPGLEVLDCHEEPKEYGSAGTEFRDAASGRLIFGLPGGGADVGRCLVADIDPDYPGCEIWSSASGGIYTCKGQLITTSLPQSTKNADSYNMAIWWSGSLNRQLLDRGVINSYKEGRLLTIYDLGITFCNGTKSNPCFYGDIWGDWREEIICASTDGKSLKIFTTDYDCDYRFPYLMSDHIYRLSAAHQNIGYNQPTHTGYYLGSDLIKK